MPDPITEVADIIEGVADDVKTETLAAVAQAEQAAKLDEIEEKLEDIEAATPETPVSSPTPHDHPEIMSAIDDLKGSVEKLGSAAADVAESAVEPAADVAEAAAAPVADVAESTAEAVESAPKRTHFLFRRWFGRG